MLRVSGCIRKTRLSCSPGARDKPPHLAPVKEEHPNPVTAHHHPWPLLAAGRIPVCPACAWTSKSPSDPTCTATATELSLGPGYQPLSRPQRSLQVCHLLPVLCPSVAMWAL